MQCHKIIQVLIKKKFASLAKAPPGETILLREWFFFIFLAALTILMLVSYLFEKSF
jgi:hypothetical protein